MWLLVSDIDDTLLGDDQAFEHLAHRFSSATDLILALNSSRPVASIHDTLEQLSAPINPRAIIGAMGTEVELNGKPLASWQQRFADWSRDPIDLVMHHFSCEPHDVVYQRPYKASYTVPDDERRSVIVEALVALEQSSRIITSGDTDFDVLPAGAGKGEATVYLAETLGVPLDRLIVAGDSRNDLAMFEVAQKGIVVGNAREELRQAVDPTGVYFARAACAGGVLEGLEHYGALP